MVTPEHWHHRGEAVLHDGDKRLLVWQGLPGETGIVKVVGRGQHQDYALWLEPVSDHPNRVDPPPCDRYTLCGGCPIMHVDAFGQEATRRELVRSALDAEGLTDVGLGAFRPNPEGLEEFRHVVKVGFGYSDRGHIRVGAWGRRNRNIVPIPKCNVAIPVLRSTMVAVAHHTIEKRIRPWVEGEGVLRAAVLRASRHTGEVLVTLVAGRRIRELNELAEEIAAQVTEVVGVWLHLNDKPGNAIFDRDAFGSVGVQPLLGTDTITDRLNGVDYLIGPGDFFQTNPALAEVLYERVLDRLDPHPRVPVIDLYSGVGGLALQAAKRGNWALGVEGVEGAVTRARESARRQDLDAEFLAADVRDALPELPRRLAGRHPVVIVDPARRGLEEGVIDGIVALAPRRVAYVSCNPKAMARDLAAFREHGLDIGEVELFDMFPNTPHVECLVVLEATGDVPEPRGRAPRRKVVR